MARTGLLGGTFDPPHRAHIAMAEAALDTLSLEHVWLLPAPQPPHKPEEELTPYAQRVEMAELLTRGVAGVGVSRFEETRNGPSFTVEMLRDYRAESNDDVYFIMGADSLRDMPTWRDPAGILSQCTLAVFPRDDIPMYLSVEGEASLVVFEAPVIHVSSREIRERFVRSQPVRDLLSEEIYAYIERNNLYRVS